MNVIITIPWPVKGKGVRDVFYFVRILKATLKESQRRSNSQNEALTSSLTRLEFRHKMLVEDNKGIKYLIVCSHIRKDAALPCFILLCSDS
ncbi:CLUMA_CG001018, isoform A [Clunio marinus]|uniref:CLUMA_CG001018, isoform A n=1 Tax=Clunio marinus TaxID=568069 RepID=A0A1J1HL83_9DIPT|nr:CLUMA_CG001018, isoform A [Clunio marinus]